MLYLIIKYKKIQKIVLFKNINAILFCIKSCIDKFKRGIEMEKKRFDLWEAGEYDYSMSCGFIPNLYGYMHKEDHADKPCVIVVPGGGYCMVSPTEAEIVAMKFYGKGYNVFVCTYTTNRLMSVPLKMQPMKDLSRAIRFVRKNSVSFDILSDKIALCGFSAGGHLCASVCVHYGDIQDSNPAYAALSNRPDAAILSYPVITSGKKAHKDSFVALLGTDASREELAYMSLEKQVSDNTPPCFLWHTATDELVPVENSIFFAEACRKHGIPFALHIFSDGPHGLSVADRDWADGHFEDTYADEQTRRVIAKIQSGELRVPPEVKADLLGRSGETWQGKEPNEEAAVWPELSHLWLKRVWNTKG